MWPFGKGLGQVLLVLYWRLRDSNRERLKGLNNIRRMVTNHSNHGKRMPSDLGAAGFCLP